MPNDPLSTEELTPYEQFLRAWEQANETDRLRFLIEALTPAERRIVRTGLLEEEGDV
jgi:hypothetical protein